MKESDFIKYKVNRRKVDIHHQGVEGVYQCERKPAAKKDKMLQQDTSAEHRGVLP